MGMPIPSLHSLQTAGYGRLFLGCRYGQKTFRVLFNLGYDAKEIAGNDLPGIFFLGRNFLHE